MARPKKQGLDFFHLLVDTDEHPKLVDLDLRDELPNSSGFGILFRILMRLYKNGYYLKWNERMQKIISHKIHTDISKIKLVIEICLAENFFNNNLYKKYRILTSRRIQEHYIYACKRRTKILLIQEFLLTNIEKDESDDKSSKETKDKIVIVAIDNLLSGFNTDNNSVNVDNNSVNVDNNSVNVDNNSVNVDNNSVNVDNKPVNVDRNSVNVDNNSVNVDNNSNDLQIEKPVNVDRNSVNVDRNSINVDRNTQKKRKENKIKNSRDSETVDNVDNFVKPSIMQNLITKIAKNKKLN
jgi:hypothetical protein